MAIVHMILVCSVGLVAYHWLMKLLPTDADNGFFVGTVDNDDGDF